MSSPAVPPHLETVQIDTGRLTDGELGQARDALMDAAVGQSPKVSRLLVGLATSLHELEYRRVEAFTALAASLGGDDHG